MLDTNIVAVTINGVSPLLLRSFGAGFDSNGEGSAIVQGKDLLPREVAEANLYLDQDQNTIIIPGPNVYRSIIDAGKYHKIGKSKVTTMKSSLVPAGIILPELELPITPQEWEVDARPVVIPATRGRVMRYRPRFDAWSVSFTLEIDTSMFSTKFVRQLVDDAGKKIGLGDFRPDCKGPFGRFVVTKWKEVEG